MKTLKEKIEVMQAALDGKEIEYCEKGEWKLIIEPEWYWGNTDYRIKPEPREFYVLMVSEEMPSLVNNDKEWLKRYTPCHQIIKVREVIE